MPKTDLVMDFTFLLLGHVLYSGKKFCDGISVGARAPCPPVGCATVCRVAGKTEVTPLRSSQAEFGWRAIYAPLNFFICERKQRQRTYTTGLLSWQTDLLIAKQSVVIHNTVCIRLNRNSNIVSWLSSLVCISTGKYSGRISVVAPAAGTGRIFLQPSQMKLKCLPV